MSDPKEIIGALYFSDHEPRVFGHFQIGNVHYEIAGIRRNDFKTDLTGRKIERRTPIAQAQMDMFEKEDSAVHRSTDVGRRWRDLRPAKQTGIRCADPVFWAWLEEQGYPRGHRHCCGNHDEAAELVRRLCGIASRSDLNKPGFTNERAVWNEIDSAFQAWRAAENG
jgi:hypothetical protein